MDSGRRKWLVFLCAAVASASCHAAASTTALDGYLDGLSTWSANFTQTSQDEHGKTTPAGRGRLVLVRPGKFRWESSPAGAGEAVQLLVADGRNLWFHDKDLDQATVKPQAEALSQSPAMLLAGGTDLRAAFTVEPVARSEGLEWVRVLPKDAASDFRECRFGFKGRELARLVLEDKLGQRSTLVFNNVKRNAPVDPALVKFAPPPGTDLIGEPVAP
jgi:outer membrane lipoprotein carrier protein